MTIQELDELRGRAIERIFSGRRDADRFFLLVSRLWRHTPENMLAIYMQNDEAKAVAGKRAFEALGLRLKDGEKPFYIYNTVIHKSDDGSYISEDRAMPAYELRQFVGLDENGEGPGDVFNEGLEGMDSNALAMARKICADAGIAVMEVDRMPREAGYFSGFFDEEEQAVIVCKAMNRELKASAILYGYVQYVFSSGENAEGLAEIEGRAGIRIREEAELLALYCVERYLGSCAFVRDPGIIVENASRELLSFEDRHRFISCVCRGVQAVLGNVEGGLFTVEETNVVNSLLISGDRKMLLKLYRDVMQSRIKAEEKVVIAKVFEDILGHMTDAELKALYEARMNRKIYTYPALRLGAV